MIVNANEKRLRCTAEMEDIKNDNENEDIARFHKACCNGNAEYVKEFLLKGTDYYLHGIELACCRGHLEIVKLLLSRGPPFQLTPDSGFLQSCLYQASFEGHLDVVKYLFSCGCTHGLLGACLKGHFNVVEYYVLSGVPVTTECFSFACSSGNPKVIALLISKAFEVIREVLFDDLDYYGIKIIDLCEHGLDIKFLKYLDPELFANVNLFRQQTFIEMSNFIIPDLARVVESYSLV